MFYLNFILDAKHIISDTRGMNKLPLQTRVQILNLLCEGSSMRAISRVTGVSINTVTKLLIDAGLACAAFHDENVHGVKARRIQCDEIWSFCYAKAKNVATAKSAPENAGDVWTWTALDSDSKMIVSYLIGGRDSEYAMAFMDDLRSRLANRVQLTTDGHKAYLNAVEEAFGADIDYGMLVKIYGEGPKTEARYSPAICTGARKETITGNPDEKHLSTSHVERSNLSMRMHMRRFTRLTNGHSKKFENHCHMVALYTVWYNYARINSAVKMAPAMAAGVSSRLWEMSDIVALIDAREEAPKRPANYRPRISN
jgi:IS1 family transposase